MEKRTTIILILALCALGGAIFFYVNRVVFSGNCDNLPEDEKQFWVAHAGGGMDDMMYLNSLEAMDENYEKGFRYFEVDVLFTSDDEVVCVHNWQEDFPTVDPTRFPLSYEEFQEVNEETDITRCDIETLAEWFREHPDAYFITDFRGDTIKGLEVVLEKFEDPTRRVIPQIYYASEYKDAEALGFDWMIWSLYRRERRHAFILEELMDMPKVEAVTMPIGYAMNGLPKKIRKTGRSVFVHTINDPDIERRVTDQYCASGVYTDFLPAGD